MKIAVAATGQTLDDRVSETFGRCPWFVIVDADTLALESIHNPAQDLPGGAGPAAVQELGRHGVTLALAGRVGPKAESALQAAGIAFASASGTIREALDGARETGSDS
jgi:predicted Fe-Mo cluster-binding NifX family protein